MATLKKIKSISNTVTKLLTNHEHLRDSDDMLIATIWHNELVKHNPTILASEFIQYLGKGVLSNPEAITRARRKVQQQNPELRGTNYQGRLKEEINVRRGINKE